MSKVRLNGFIIVPKEELSAVKQELSNHIELTRKEEGCLIFDVTQNLTNPCRFEVNEVFADKAAFECHQQRVKSSKWGEISVNVERHYEIAD